MVELRAVREVLARCPDARLAYAFGSVAAGRERAASDLDLAVLFARDLEPAALDRLTADLEAAAGRPVDLVVLANAPPLLAHEIVSRGALLFCRDDAERIDFAARAIARYLDTAHLRKVQHSYLREHAEGHRAASR